MMILTWIRRTVCKVHPQACCRVQGWRAMEAKHLVSAKEEKYHIKYNLKDIEIFIIYFVHTLENSMILTSVMSM